MEGQYISPNNFASLSVELFVHFGFFTNLNLCNRGIYYVHVTLDSVNKAEYLNSPATAQKKRHSPYNCYSAPLSFDVKFRHSSIDHAEVFECPLPIQLSQLKDKDQSFLSRSVYVRFKDEIHELNDGASWNITIPNVLLGKSSNSIPQCDQLFILNFKLMYHNYINNDPTLIVEDLEKCLPKAPFYIVAASQQVVIQDIFQGTHEYYPITFNKNFFANVDCLIHCNVTAIEHNHQFLDYDYNPSSPSPSSPSSPTGEVVNEDRAVETEETAVREDGEQKEELSVTSPARMDNKKPPLKHHSPSKVKRDTVSDELTANQLDFPDDESATLSTPPPSVPASHLSTPREVPAIEFDDSIDPYISKYIISHFSSYNTFLGSLRDFFVELTAMFTPHEGQLTLLDADLTEHRKDIAYLNELLAVNHFRDLSDRLQHHCQSLDEAKAAMTEFQCRFQETLNEIWTMVLWNIKKPVYLRHILQLLRHRYLLHMRGFWKRQLLVQSTGLSRGKSDHPCEREVFRFLNDKICLDHSMTQMTYEKLQKANCIEFARGLTVYDPAVHQRLLELPMVLLQQYYDDTVGYLQSGKEESAIRGGAIAGVREDTSVAQLSDIMNIQYLLHLQADGGSAKPTQPMTTGASTSPSNSEKGKGTAATHLVVFVHGYQGRSQDMTLFASTLSGIFPSIKVLCCQSNNAHSEESIVNMSYRISHEILSYCEDFAPELLVPTNTTSKISFIGHSLGGVVIRHVVKNSMFQPFLSKLHLYISLSSPHLGAVYNESPLFNAGMWTLSNVMKRNKCDSLKELLLQDNSDPEKCVLFQLSRNQSFQYFNRVILISNVRDQYVSLSSARIQQCTKAVGDVVYQRMLFNILTSIDASKLVRVTLDTPNDDYLAGLSSKALNLNEVTNSVFNIDSMIGRSAHVAYLDNPIVVTQLIFTLYPFFQSSEQ